MIALSCIVVVCTVYALSLPAQTMACDKEEHTHTAECYDENNELICEKEEHTHNEDCNKQEEVNEQEEVVKDEPETINNEQVSQVSEEETTTTTTETTTEPFDLSSEANKGKITDIQFTYKKDGVVVKPNQSVDVSKHDDLSMTYKLWFEGIPATTLKQCGGIMSYKLPEGFTIKKSIDKNITSGSDVIGTMNVSTDGLVTIKYYDTYLKGLNDNQTLTGNFEVEAQIDMNKIDSSTGKVTITTPKGDITLNYGLDYKEHYGSVSVDKSCKKETTSDYIKYTITLTAGDDGCQNVYVVDQFTKGKELVEYVDINLTESTLYANPDKQQPYETRKTATKGTIYKTNLPSSDQEIPNAVTNITNPESFVWNIAKMEPNEVRTLTYYVKLIDTTENLYNKQYDIVNNAQVYSKQDNSSQVYSKGNRVSTFKPTIIINTNVMKKNIVTQNGNDYIKEDGNYLVNYQIEFNYGSENNNCSIKEFQFRDSLDSDIYTDSKMLPYISFVENSIVLHVKKAGETEYTDYSGSHITVGWAKGNDNYSTYKEDSTRFNVYELNNQPITINPGDSYYVTYTLKIKPEVYAAMQSNSVTIKNRYFSYSRDKLLNKVFNDKLNLHERKWVEKSVAEPTTAEKTVDMDGTKYNNQLKVDTSAEQLFKVPAGSYKYTVNINKTDKDKTDGKFNITNVTLADALDNKDVMKYVGYMKITAYDTDDRVVETKWVNIDKQQNFSLRLSDIDWTKNCYSYTFEYYATPNDLSSLTSAKVNNTFSLNGDVKRGVDGEIFRFTNVNSSSEVTLEGSYNLKVNKQAWYYEKPKQNATEWQNGMHYWVIEVNGSKIRAGTQIKDEINDVLGKDEISSYLHKDSLVGVYKGDFKNLSDYKTIDALPKESKVGEEYYKAEYSNDKHFSGENNYSELVLTTKKDIDLQENEKIYKIYIVVKTEPKELPSELPEDYRATFKYKNEVEIKHKGDKDFTKVNDATQELYGGNYILKELGQTFEFKNGKYTNISKGKDTDNPESKIVKDKLIGNGIYASWAFKVNYGGDLNGDYRVLETIPDGMELSYIRIKWTGKSAKDITSQTITDLGDDWKVNTIAAPDDDNSNITTTYYVKGKQALIQLGKFKGIHGRDDYSVDVQVVCRVTDPDVLLGGETKTFTNKVMLQSPDGTKDYVSANASAEISNIKILNKENVHNVKSPKIDYTITANEYGQTLLKNTTDKLTLVDDLDENLVLDPDSIKAKNIKNNSDVPIEKKYDPVKNILEIQIPDSTPVQITYSCKVKAAPNTEIPLVSNRVYWKNYAQTGGVNDEIKQFSYDLNASGTTETETHPQLKIIKYDDTLKRLSGAEFEIHECELVNDKIQYKSPVNSTTAISGADGTVIIPTDKFPMDFNTIYEVKETNPVDGYILDDTPYYIMRAKKEDSGNDYSDYVKEYIKIAYQNSKDKHYIVAYDKDYFLVKIYNAQQGITVKKAFTNNAAETKHNPVSGIYKFGLYENENGEGKPLEIISIHYDPKDKDVKSAKFKNPIDLTKDYYVFEIGQNNQPIKASDDEATINSMQYKVVYNNETDSTKTNNAKVGETVIVTNKSRTKILPSTGSMGTLIYRLLGATLVVASLIYLSNINKNNRKEKRRKK